MFIQEQFNLKANKKQMSCSLKTKLHKQELSFNILISIQARLKTNLYFLCKIKKPLTLINV